MQYDDRETLTRAEMVLKSDGGPAAIWRLLVPLGATVKLAKDDEPRMQNLASADQKFASLRTFRLKEAATELKVTVTVRGPQPRAGTVAPVGPFVLQNAVIQTGDLNVVSNLQDVKLEYSPRGDVVPAAGAGAFQYASITLPDRPQATTGPSSMSLLDIEPRSTRGLVETTVSHVLRLVRDDARGRVWRVKTTIDAKPFRTGVDHLDVLLPPMWVYDDKIGPMPAALVRSVELAAPTRALRFKLANDPLQPFKISFEAEYQQAAGDTGKATLLLPKPLDTRDRGGQVSILAPEDTELLPPDSPLTAFEPTVQERQQQVWQAAHIPERIEVSWRPYRPEVRATSVVDLTLTPREGQVRQLFRFQFPRSAPAQISLRIPDAIADRWTIIHGGTVSGMGNGAGRLIKLAAPAEKEQGHLLLLEYSFSLPEGAETLSVPLVTLEQIASGECKARLERYGCCTDARKRFLECGGY